MNRTNNPHDFLILIVDDIPVNLKILHGILENVGYQLTFANSGKQALTRITKIKPDLILLDLMMPEMDGLEVAKILSENEDYQDIPIIFLTASQEKGHLTDAFEKGAVDYIIKPFNKSELLARIKNHLQLKHYRDCLLYQVKQEQLITQITQNILSNLALDTILNYTVSGIRTLFLADRVVICRFDGQDKGEIIAESIKENWLSLLGEKNPDWEGIKNRKQPFIQILDLNETENLSPFQKNRLQNLQIKTELIIPLIIQDNLWGILRVNHCSHSHQWQENELKSLTQIIQQTQIAIKQGELYQQLQSANQELAYLAYYDKLTDIYNRRQFDLSIEEEWLRLRREKLPLSLILCDIDHFKEYNDTYGHPSGDICLHQVAQAIDKVIKRPSDKVCRYGGEEFAIILPNTDEKGAIEVAKLVQQAIAELKITHYYSKVEQITLSMGLATAIPSRESNFKALIKIADKGLYLAKNNGRNQFKIVEPEYTFSILMGSVN